MLDEIGNMHKQIKALEAENARLRAQSRAFSEALNEIATDILHMRAGQLQTEVPAEVRNEIGRLADQVEFLLKTADDAIDDLHAIQIHGDTQLAVRARLILENRLSDFNVRFGMAYEKFLEAKEANQETPKP